ncbi:MAG: arginyltransferase [Myxococcota bacterium]
MSAPTPRRVIAASPPELVVHDAPSPCPYLPDQMARLPLRLPVRRLRPRELSTRLAVGDRRQGLLLYRTACEACQACEPIRLDVNTFQPNKTQRRVFRRGQAVISTEIGPLQATNEKVALYNKHKHLRNLTSGERTIDLDGYTSFLGESCCDTFELRYRIDDTLVGVAIIDRGSDALSAVYCYFDPDHENLSPGVFSILKQVELAKRWGLTHVYLGLYIAECASMSYKSRYLPHERRTNGQWHTVERKPAKP